MTFRELSYLVVLAQEKHFGRTAERCHVSQPSLSMAIKKLEDTLGVAIFERTRNELLITPVGREIISRAERIVEDVKALTQLAKTQDEALEMPLKLGGIPSILPYILPTFIPALKTLAPKMPVILQEQITETLRKMLVHGDLDVIIVSLPFSEPGILVQPLYEESLKVLLPTSHPLADKPLLLRQDLMQETLLTLGPGHCFRDQVFQACSACVSQNPLQEMLEGVSLETLKYMVVSGVGVTILPEMATRMADLGDLLCVKPFEDGGVKRPIALAYRVTFPRFRAIELVKTALLGILPDICR